MLLIELGQELGTASTMLMLLTLCFGSIATAEEWLMRVAIAGVVPITAVHALVGHL